MEPVRVAIITESFLPTVNGVTNSVLRVLEHLRAEGHQAMVIAAEHPDGVPERYLGFPIRTVPSVALPWYRDLRFATVSSATIEHLLIEFAPDVVHLAAPVTLGSKGMAVTARLGIPTVAIYQTDIANYIGQYYFPSAEALMWRHLRRLHNLATLTLAPSSYSRDQLLEQGVARVAVWGRGVDGVRFNPRRRDEALHRSWAPQGERVIGYMGRLAAEKSVANLAVLSDIPNTRLVIVGDGPEREQLEQVLPGAVFTGMKSGEDLPRHLASFDLFVHTGELETFGQTIQEAAASGLAIVAPAQGGPLDLVDNSRTGWLYAPGDLAGLRSRVLDLIGDDAKRAAFARAARAGVARRSWTAVCAQLVEHYREAIDLGASSRLIAGELLRN